MTDSITPRMSWDDPDLPSAIQIFRQQCELYFSVKNVKAEQQVDHILLFMGSIGLRKYNSWSLPDADAKNANVVWDRFVAQLTPRKFRQNDQETVDDFMSRLKLHAQTCHFRDDKEFADRIIEQFIADTKHADLQKKLLAEDDKLSIDQCLDIARTHEASLSHMEQLTNVNQANPSVDVMQRQRTCRNCGRAHSFKSRELCPAFGTTCNVIAVANKITGVKCVNHRIHDRTKVS